VKPGLKRRMETLSKISNAFIYLLKSSCSTHIDFVKNSLSSNIKGKILVSKWIAPEHLLVLILPNPISSCNMAVSYIVLAA